MSELEPTDNQDSDCIDYKDADTLERLYWDRGMSTQDIADIADVHHSTILRQMQKRDVPRRGRSKSVSMAVRSGQIVYRTNESNGYTRIEDSYMGETSQIPSHRLLAVAKYGFDQLKGKHVHHKNRIPWDNRPGNIELLDPKEHHRLHGRQESHDSHKLTPDDVREIKKKLDGAEMTQKEIADMYGVTHSNISSIKRGVSWTHVKLDG